MLAAEIDGQLDVVAERARGRADALVALPRMAWAVSTDVATVRDMTADELALAPRTGETIEIAQWNIAANQSIRLLRVPPDGTGPSIPIEQAGEHFLASPQGIFFAVVRMIDARQRADEVKGLIGVAEKWDAAAVEKRLVSIRAKLRIETANGATVWGTPAPASAGPDDHFVIVPLRAAAAAGSRLVFTAAPPKAAHRGVLVPVGGALIVAAALAFWRDRRAGSPREVEPSSSRAKLKTNPAAKEEPKTRDSEAASEATAPGGPTPTAAATKQELTAGASSSTAATAASAAGRGAAAVAVSRSPDLDSRASDTNPEISIPAIPPALVTTARLDASVAGRIPPVSIPVVATTGAAKSVPGKSPGVEAPTPLVTPPARPYLPRASSAAMRSSSQAVPLLEPASAEVPMDYHGTERNGVTTAADGELQGQPAVIGDDWGATNPSVVRTLRRLYDEFLALRRTCGERTDNIDYDKFVATLRRRREELIARHLFKEVTFRIAFNDGKAIVRSTGIR